MTDDPNQAVAVLMQALTVCQGMHLYEYLPHEDRDVLLGIGDHPYDSPNRIITLPDETQK
jgi:hypothetical protein